ncbi:MAG: dethiobiotin synthase [Thaumarchaeota archaeon]|nr:dethiobiotin synthase [Nitrososphaerota archaeon]
MKSYFLTGTDTGVGKTTITAALAFSLRRRGIDVGVMKPLATGDFSGKGFKSEDVALLHAAAGVMDAEDVINPIFLPVPASPYDASKILNVGIDMDVVFERFKLLMQSHQMVLVEGIGGIMTPITRNFFVADMIQRMEIETIIVTRSTLGTLNHTVMTAEMCKKYGIQVKGLVVNAFGEKGGPEEKNAAETLGEVTGLEVLGRIPFVRDYGNTELMADTVEENLNLDKLIS